MNADTVSDLEASIDKLPAKDVGFARSLIASVKRYGSATTKQAYWLDELLSRTKGEAKAATTAAVGDLASVYRMFDIAKGNLKAPAIVLGYEGGELKIRVATAQSRTPGALQVIDQNTGTWYGRVHKDGTFEQSRRDTPPASLIATLSRFAADPIKAASESGRLTGKCCFCNRPLTGKDGKSAAVGYGPICAARFGLEWGVQKVPAALIAA